MNIINGCYKGNDLKIGIIISRFNSTVTSELLEGACDCLTRHDVKDKDIDVYYVPGALEIPFTAKQLLKTDKYDGLIALSAVIRGDTYHFEIVSNEASKGISQLNIQYDIPITFGVLTTDNLEQAFNRSGLKSGNKGFESALALLELINLKQKIS